jgi:hypothetical protein
MHRRRLKDRVSVPRFSADRRLRLRSMRVVVSTLVMTLVHPMMSVMYGIVVIIAMHVMLLRLMPECGVSWRPRPRTLTPTLTLTRLDLDMATDPDGEAAARVAVPLNIHLSPRHLSPCTTRTTRCSPQRRQLASAVRLTSV